MKFIIFLATLSWVAHGQVTVNQPPQFIPNGDMARFALREDTPPGSPVYKLQGSDPEGSSLLYAISGEFFTVDKSSGVVILTKALDRETMEVLTVVISITDEAIGNSEANTISLRRDIPILDINDNPPVFEGRPYNLRLFETIEPGTRVYQNVTVTDKDGGINGDVILTCFPAADAVCSTFDITAEKVSEGKYQGIITLLKPLDFERQRSYSLTLKAVDRAKEPARRLSATANVVIEVLDVQDQRPVFLQTPYSAAVNENTPKGVSILRVAARDGDVGDPRPVKIEIMEDEQGYFELVPITEDLSEVVSNYDVITSDIPLDREHPDMLDRGGVYSFTLRATELINGKVPADFTDVTVTIVVTDTDDLFPVFNHPLFHINVSEGIEVDSPLPGLSMTVTDGDIGDNARYSLSLRDVWQSEGVVALHPLTGQGHTVVVLRINDTFALDYETRDNHTVIFDVVAGVPNEFGVVREVASSRVYLHVQDANDNVPQFENPVIRLTVSEDEPPGAIVASITATDKDSGVNGRLKYSLKGHAAGKFVTHPVNGGIYIGDKPLDYEEQRSYTVSLMATDGGNRSSVASVYIDVLDVNDNSPQFELKEFSRTIRTKSTSFQPEFFITATDKDGPMQGGGRIRYEVVEKNFDGNVLDVDSKTGEVLIRGEVSPEHTPKGQYELTVRAWDQGNPPRHADARVNVRVGYQGNQRPYFRGNSHLPNGIAYYNLTVRENALPGARIYELEAVDLDGANGQLKYSISENGKDNFAVEPESGILKTSEFVDLDLERNPNQYHLKVEVVDQGYPVAETGTVTVLVNVLDVNNKAPVFQRDSYTFYVKDDADVNSTVGEVQATDPDSSRLLSYSVLGNVTYFDKAGLPVSEENIFDVTANGKIFLKRLIPSVVNHVRLKIGVEDLNAEGGVQVSWTDVEIYVQSRSVMNPFFTDLSWSPKNKSITIELEEETEANSVFFKIKAKDPLDKGGLEYQTLRNDFPDTFQIGASGDVYVLRKLDYDVDGPKSWDLIVRVLVVEDFFFEIHENKGDQVLDLQQLPSVRFADALLHIKLKNINDHSPVFEQETFRKRIMESLRYPEIILQVKAIDLDKDLITYTLSGDSASYFAINSSTGEITVGRNMTLDREKQAIYRMNVTAMDVPENGPPRQTHANVWIEALDVNDNPPVFSQTSYSTVIPENVLPGTRIVSIRATDRDLGLAGEIVYSLQEDGEVAGLFSIDAKTGDVTTKVVLTGRGRAEPYQLVVKAADKGDQVLDSEGRHSQESHSSDVSLTVYIGDVVVNDGVPVFIRPETGQHANISEDAPPNTPVFQVIATDPDDPNSPEGQIRFKFLRQGKKDPFPFKINEETGLITSRASLDREKKASYQIIIVAYDKGDVPQEATRLLQVDILDVDDHPPRFSRSLNEPPVQMRVVEEVKVGTEVGLVQCHDPDAAENALIDYVISDGNNEGLFGVERTSENIGVIRVTGRVDRERTDSHLITVKCFKKEPDGKKLNYLRPYDLSDLSERQISIKVDDIDDNDPAFASTNITLGVRLNVPVGTVLTTLKATDADMDSASLVYSIERVTFHPLRKTKNTLNTSDVFSIDEKTGELRTTAPLRIFADGHLEVLVRANNSDIPERYAHLSAKVFILREKNLLKLVFDKTPRDIQPILEKVENAVASALKVPKVNIYDTQYYTHADGGLDFSSTSSCFQVIGNTSYTVSEAELLLNLSNNSALRDVFALYGIKGVERCASGVSQREASWAQLTVLILAVIIGLITLIAALSLCCCYARYKRQVQKRIQARRQVPTVVPPPDYMTVRNTPSSVMGSQMISKAGRSVRGSQLTLNKAGSSILLNQPATQMGSQLIINPVKNQPIIMGSQMLTARSGIYDTREDFGSQIMYEYVQDGADNIAFEDT